MPCHPHGPLSPGPPLPAPSPARSYLPQATVAFVDEIFKANSAILNTLLTLLNERLFDNGAARVRVPLLCLVRHLAWAGRGNSWAAGLRKHKQQARHPHAAASCPGPSLSSPGGGKHPPAHQPLQPRPCAGRKPAHPLACPAACPSPGGRLQRAARERGA